MVVVLLLSYSSRCCCHDVSQNKSVNANNDANVCAEQVY